MRLVIVESSERVIESYRQLLRGLPGVEIVGTAVSEDEACNLIRDVRPDLVLLALGLSAGSGLGVLKRIRASGSRAKVLVATSYVFDCYRRAVLADGANGFYDKACDSQALLGRLAAELAQLGGSS
jgi:diguanylate cyclase